MGVHRRRGMQRGPQNNPWEAGGGAHKPTDLATEAAELIEALVTGGFALAGWLVRHPVVLLIGAGGWGWWLALGWPSLTVAAGAVGACGLLWRWRWPVSFERLVWRRIRTGWLRMWVYELRWSRWARASHLVLYDEDFADPVIPRLRSVSSGLAWDDVRVRMLPGQKARDYELAAESLAASRKVARCSVREISPGVISLGFLRRDPLQHPVALPPITPVAGEVMNLERVRIGETEHGQPWRVPVLGSHVFGAGMMGAGKGSLMWGTVRQAAPAIACGRVKLSMIDPKGGMEAEPATALYDRYAREEPKDIVEVLTACVDGMNDRKRALRGVTRKVAPSVEHPLHLLMVDELAAVTKYLGDKKLQVEAERLLGLLLTQGRALAYACFAFAQEPTKDIVPFRGLFPYRVALRLDSPQQTDMVLGDGAWQRGAWADRIGVSTPGVGYVVEEGVREPLRVRAGYTDDAELDRIAGVYAAPR
ncbi:FtsK/SpoIIIE domain-containing protein [Saccharopolyspora erythraea]|nr:FtsK/SpoIIIE domain-containing protein [Saccharopolyspora erythraea]QRK88815.1 cell division protein FtsK [Saccharopolyspora erythraea]